MATNKEARPAGATEWGPAEEKETEGALLGKVPKIRTCSRTRTCVRNEPVTECSVKLIRGTSIARRSVLEASIQLEICKYRVIA